MYNHVDVSVFRDAICQFISKYVIMPRNVYKRYNASWMLSNGICLTSGCSYGDLSAWIGDSESLQTIITFLLVSKDFLIPIRMANSSL